MSQQPLQLDRANNAYYVVTLASSSSLYSSPATLSDLHPSLNYVGRVGELEDTHVYSSPLGTEDVVARFLKERSAGSDGIVHVEFPEERELYKRSKKDEL
ncbi:hypothetical protein FA15DRAFT_671594 [Coprinopsis marcescibilis]|uniref:Uncharacterized protein n=1 Tax=Coprinopsis marcescibilis TaxID=230819 RepID=A0A5C3KPG1_COPMA|nr:hypothetical protein FA15DRAFT_671594 [Coprinopsis marcescibilis]